MIKKILSGLVIVVALLVIFIALQSSTYHVERTATINAPSPVVFAQVNEFHKWNAWSPWAKLDPAMKQTFEGAKIKLDFLRPFAATSDTIFTFKPDGNQTAVTWSMTGEKNFIAKAFHLFVNMDKMIGGDFEKGLAQMKAVAEAAPKQ